MDSLYLSVFIALLAVYVVVLFSVGWYFNKKQKSVTDFWIAGRKLGPVPIGFSAAASWITAGGSAPSSTRYTRTDAIAAGAPSRAVIATSATSGALVQ